MEDGTANLMPSFAQRALFLLTNGRCSRAALATLVPSPSFRRSGYSRLACQSTWITIFFLSILATSFAGLVNVHAAESRGSSSKQICTTDDDCGEGRYCKHQRCRQIERPINVLYLYYRSGDKRTTRIMGIYWHHDSARNGYRVVAPIYWHFWSTDSKTRIVAPFYWSFSSKKRGHRHRNLVIPPVQIGQSGDIHYTRVWPLFFHTSSRSGDGSTVLLPIFYYAKRNHRAFGIIPVALTFFRSNDKADTSQGLAGGLYYWNRRGRIHQRRFRATQIAVPAYVARRRHDRSTAWALPLNIYWRKRDKKNLVAFPLFWRTWSRKHSRWLSLAPPIFYNRGNNGTTLVVPPIYYRRTAKSRVIVCAAVLSTTRQAQQHRCALSPVWSMDSPAVVDNDSNYWTLGPPH